jgi:hypothetical protein
MYTNGTWTVQTKQTQQRNFLLSQYDSKAQTSVQNAKKLLAAGTELWTLLVSS